MKTFRCPAVWPPITGRIYAGKGGPRRVTRFEPATHLQGWGRVYYRREGGIRKHACSGTEWRRWCEGLIREEKEAA